MHSHGRATRKEMYRRRKRFLLDQFVGLDSGYFYMPHNGCVGSVGKRSRPWAE